jgi:hypothetical protein
MDRITAANKGLAKVSVQCYPKAFAVNQSWVLRINICGANRYLRYARNYCVPYNTIYLFTNL